MVKIVTYPQALSRLNSLPSEAKLTHKRFKLDSIIAALRSIGDPQHSYRSIHIAGTSGKGSVVALVSSGLRKAGYKVGSYYSPHLETPRERIQVNSRLISKKAFTTLLKKNWQVIEKYKLSYFEAMTMLAFDYFKSQKVDFVVVEVGLGGRLDATNVITPKVSVITSIDFDHEWLLGDTLSKIATEKAGIIKPGVPVISGATQPLVKKVISRIAKQKKAAIEFVSTKGTFDQINHQIAKATLSQLSIRLNPAPDAELAGRFEVVGDIILDSAHNPAKMQALVKRFKLKYPNQKAIVVFAAKYDKQAKKMKKILEQIAREIVTTQPSESIHTFHKGQFRNPIKAYKHSLEHKNANDIIIITGSMYLVGELRHVVLQRPKIS